MDVNMRRTEDVLAHKRLLELAKDLVQRQAFTVGVVQRYDLDPAQAGPHRCHCSSFSESLIICFAAGLIAQAARMIISREKGRSSISFRLLISC